MKVLKFLFLFLIAVIIGVFAAHNATPVPINFYPFNLEVSVAVFLLVLAAVFIGAVLSAIICSAKILQARKLARLRKKEIERLQKEIAGLKPREVTVYGN